MLYCTMDTFSALTGIETTPRSLFVYLKEDVTEQELSDIREWLGKPLVHTVTKDRKSRDRRIIIERSQKVDMLRSAAMILTSSVTLWAVLMFEVYSRRD